MSQFQSTDLQTGFFAERSAVWIGWALLAAFATLLLAVSRDYGNRRQLETLVEATAVGDQTYFKPPIPGDAAATAPIATVNFKGQTLLAVTPKPVVDHDVRMYRAGMDESGVYRIYVSHDPADLGKKGEPSYFLKLGTDEYLEVRPAGK